MKKFLMFIVILLLIPFTLLAQQGWFWQNPLPQGNNLNDVYLSEDGTSIAVGDAGTILKINASGQINEIRHNICGYADPFRCIFFSTLQTGWIGGSGEIIKSDDGGANWNRVNLDPNLLNGLPVNSIFFTTDSRGWISAGTVFWGGGSLGSLLRTDDGGNNWICIDQYNFWIDNQFLNTDTGYGIMYNGDFLYKTVNGGMTWNTVSQITL